MSLSLLALLTEVMTMIGMENLYLTGTGYSISFARSSVCLDLSHFFVSFQFKNPPIPDYLRTKYQFGFQLFVQGHNRFSISLEYELNYG